MCQQQTFNNVISTYYIEEGMQIAKSVKLLMLVVE
uniref:Uncharacterized protein n=1 Tax=Arundo donax TaxID=35708 RepID=A0A0A9FTU7_ARUDO